MKRALALTPHHLQQGGYDLGNDPMNISILHADQVLDPPTTVDGGSSGSAPGVVVVAVDGDVDLYSGPDLKQALVDVLAPVHHGPRGAASQAGAGEGGVVGSLWAVVVDLSRVEFIDSSALGVLVQGHHLARRRGCAYAVVATHPMIYKLFAITGLARVMPLHRDVAAAVAGLPPTTRFTASPSTAPTSSPGEALT